ncbi:hypothetical protein [Bradyrhizobium sp. WSM1417]|uniref:hypothetical protein n=1 Tax=Bradyrhizobium sp. WSM1417 TaxID=754500 RepID=UPI0004B7EA47|nr:hypothetical protein [Bradyrhizobium sp. WSM1417]
MPSAARSTISVSIFTNRDEIKAQFPTKWLICSHCEGTAKSSSHLGAFTASEWADQDDDFRDDYLAGRYDVPCQACDGLGRVQLIDRNAVIGWRQRILLNAFDAQERDSRACDAIHAAERRMGA